MEKVVVITGGSSGIGKAAAALFAKDGNKVYELSRSGKGGGGVNHITADVTKQEEVFSAFETIGKTEGRVDVLVNNAGVGVSGVLEFTPQEEAKHIFDVNFFGTLFCCQAALPYLRKSSDGRIINLSSVAAPLALPFQGLYSATKSAVNSLTLALINEVKPFGIHVSALMPGDASTGFTDARQKQECGQEIYGAAISKAVSNMEKDEREGMTAEYVAKCVYKLSKKRRPKPLYTAGVKYKFFVLLAKLLPVSLSNYIVGKLY